MSAMPLAELFDRAVESTASTLQVVGDDGNLRDECLNETLFTSLSHARAELAEWQHYYNTVRPHSKLGGRTPAEIAKQAAPGHAPALLVIPSTISQTMEGLYF